MEVEVGGGAKKQREAVMWRIAGKPYKVRSHVLGERTTGGFIESLTMSNSIPLLRSLPQPPEPANNPSLDFAGCAGVRWAGAVVPGEMDPEGFCTLGSTSGGQREALH